MLKDISDTDIAACIFGYSVYQVFSCNFLFCSWISRNSIFL